MFSKFPRLFLKENREVLSMEEVLLWVRVAQSRGKICLFGLYPFARWRDGKPDPNSVILDVIGLEGKKETLEKLGEEYLKEGKQSLFIYDGEKYLLFVEHDGSPLEKVKEPEGTSLIKDIYFKFTYPNTKNPITGEISKIIMRFKK